MRVEIGQKPGVVRGTGSSNPSPSSGESRANLTSSAQSLEIAVRDLKLLGRLLWHIARREPQAFLHLVRAFYAARRNPGAFGAIFTMAAMYLHLGPFSRYVIAMLDQRIDRR